MADEGTKKSDRDGKLNMYYNVALVFCAVAVIWRWIFSSRYGFVEDIAAFSACIFILLGFLNSTGLFSRLSRPTGQ